MTFNKTGQITTLAEREEVGSKKIYEQLDTTEKLTEYIGRALEHIEKYPSFKSMLGSSTGHLMVDVLVYLNKKYKDNPDELVEKTGKVIRITRGFVNKKNNEDFTFDQGFLSETAMCLSLDELGFTVVEPSLNEDMESKIDCFVYDKHDPTFTCAIQIKSSSRENEVQAIRLDTDPKTLNDNLYSQNTFIDETDIYLFRQGLDSMLQYLASHKKDFLGRVIPLLIIVPNEGSENCAYNIRTGKPRSGFKDELYDKLEGLIYEEE